MKYRNKIPLQFKILFGYMILLAVIGSMVAILLHERSRMSEIEAEVAEIRQVRRNINTAHRRIMELANLGESVIGWTETDHIRYHDLRLRTDSLLEAMKPHCREYVRPVQIDSLRILLAEKENHLLHITEARKHQGEADSLLTNRLPEVARRATRIRTVKRKKDGLAGAFGARRPCRYSPRPRNCTNSATV